MDIQMPDLTGLQLSKIVKGKTNIILRPYPQFALQSYEVDAIDY
jgi:YesN/AraC family two-component response regulator